LFTVNSLLAFTDNVVASIANPSGFVLVPTPVNGAVTTATCVPQLSPDTACAVHWLPSHVSTSPESLGPSPLSVEQSRLVPHNWFAFQIAAVLFTVNSLLAFTDNVVASIANPSGFVLVPTPVNGAVTTATCVPQLSPGTTCAVHWLPSHVSTSPALLGPSPLSVEQSRLVPHNWFAFQIAAVLFTVNSLLAFTDNVVASIANPSGFPLVPSPVNGAFTLTATSPLRRVLALFVVMISPPSSW
jgi:hypothetical protein